MPKVIHFIWAGGARPFPNDEVIKDWRDKNPDCQIILWVDKSTTSRSVFNGYINQLNYRQEGQGAPTLSQVMKGRANPKACPSDKPPVIFADIEDLFSDAKKVLDPALVQYAEQCIRYEIGRFHPNYGASSDLLRYLALATYGGAYFDSDVLAGKNPIDQRYFGVKQYRMSGKTQGVYRPGNDAFVCSPQHPHMIGILKLALKNYQVDWLNEPNQYDDVNYVAEMTPMKTGPDLILEYMVENKMGVNYTAPRIPEKYEIDESCYTSKSKNDRNWIGVPIQSCSFINHAFNIARQSLTFECENIKILRLGDHTRDIITSIQQPFLKELENLFKDILQKHMPVEIDDIGKDLFTAFQHTFKIDEKTLNSIIKQTLKENKSVDDPRKLINHTLKILLNDKKLKLDHAALIKLMDPKYQHMPMTGLKSLLLPAQLLQTECCAVGVELLNGADIQILNLVDCVTMIDELKQDRLKISLIETKVGECLALRMIGMQSLDQSTKARIDANPAFFKPCVEIIDMIQKNPQANELIKVMDELNRCLAMADNTFFKSQKHPRALEVLKGVKMEAYKAQDMVLDTVKWWQACEKTNSDEVELKCKLLEIKAQVIDVQSSHYQGCIKLGEFKSETQGILFALRDSAKEQRMAAFHIRDMENRNNLEYN